MGFVLVIVVDYHSNSFVGHPVETVVGVAGTLCLVGVVVGMPYWVGMSCLVGLHTVGVVDLGIVVVGMFVGTDWFVGMAHIVVE